MLRNTEVATESSDSSLRALERHVEREVELLDRGAVTAFIVQEADVVLVVELRAALRGMISQDQLVAAVSDAVMARHADAPSLVVLRERSEVGSSARDERRQLYAQRWREGTLGGFAVYQGGVPILDAQGPAEDFANETEHALAAIFREALKSGAVARDTSFFALGGSSLAAADVCARVERAFAVTLPVSSLFEAPTVSALAAHIDALRNGEQSCCPRAIARISRERRLPLSPAQRQMRFLWQLDPEGGAYNISGALKLRGVLDVSVLEKTFVALQQRHEALRTSFPEDRGEPYQHIDQPRRVQIHEDDLRSCAADEREQLAEELTLAEALAPFDLARGPLFRVRVIHAASDDHRLIFTLHHSVADGASMNVLIRDFRTFFAASGAGEEAVLPVLDIQYADYAHWQHTRLHEGEAQRQLTYWQGVLGDEQPMLALPTDRPRPSRPSHHGARVRFDLPASLMKEVRALAQAQRASVFMVLLAAFKLLLYRQTGQQDVRVGIPTANRLRAGAERLVGPFVNTQVLRSVLSERASFLAVLQQVRRAAMDAQAHQELPFEELVQALQPARDAAHHPLFQVMYNHQQRDYGALSSLPGLTVEDVCEVESPVTRFDLSLQTVEDGEGRVSAAIVYATDLFDAARIERLARHFVQILRAALRDVDSPIGALPWLDSDERAELEAYGVLPERSFRPGFVHEWVGEQARLRPDGCALTFAESSLSYAELWRRAEGLSAALVASGARPESVVGVLMERSLELVIGLLAILKTGAAYLPLDPEAPLERTAFMVADAKVGLILTRGDSLRLAAPLTGCSVLDFDAASASAVTAGASAPSAFPLHGDQLAYLLYTSGTTGEPKAVAVTHGALAQRLAWMQQEYGIAAGETLLHKTPLVFDVSVWELFWSLANGARLVIAPPGDHRDPRQLARLIQRHGVSTIHFVPSLLREFVAEESVSECGSLRRLFSGGEALSPELADDVLARLPQVRLDNRYGPTEALINATCWTCERGAGGRVPIGHPIPNTTVRILDRALQPVPVGVTGELYLGGAVLARCYVGRPGLTAASFVPDPFASKGGARLYRSGDWARFREDGAIEYLGRRDTQIKIRGVRLELGELESALQRCPGVKAAVAVALPGPSGVARLVAYVTGVAREAIASLHKSLEQTLPSPLVPAQIVPLAELPRLTSGKLDRSRLPAPSWESEEYVAPRSQIEREVAEIWQEVLGVERAGLADDFFALGGHSLLATQVVSRLRMRLGIELPLRELFEARDLATLCARVESALAAGRTSRQPEIARVDRAVPQPLSYSQERMWFLWSLEPESAAYNVGGAVKLRGPLDVAALEGALAALVVRHEGFRTTFPRVHGVPMQRIHERASIGITHVDLAERASAERAAEVRRITQAEAHGPFDLENGPLLRVKLLRLGGAEHVLLVTLHHIIAEGWAMDIFASEYVALYEALRAGHSSPLPTHPVEYADYAAWQRRWLEAGEAELQLEYWRRTLGTEHPPLELPADRPRPATQSFRGDYHRFVLDRALSAQVRAFGVARGATLNMTINAALLAFLHRYTGERDLRIGYPVANRVRPEFEGLIGAFLNTQVLRCEVTGQLSAAELLEHVKRASIEAQSHQDVPFHSIARALQPVRSAAHLPLFQVMCNVQRWQFQQTRRVADLTLEFVPNDSRTAKCDLALDVADVDDELACSLTYSTDLFDAETIERMALHWRNLLRDLVSRPAARVSELALFDATERDARLACWNGAREVTRAAPLLHSAIVARWKVRPDVVALVDDGQRLSAGALLRRASQLGRRLRALGVRPEVRVGIYLPGSAENVLAMMAVLQAGGAFVPLDPQHPTERLAYMAREAAVRIVLTRRAWSDALVVPGAIHQEVDDPSLANEVDEPLDVQRSRENLAYIIYTSGSTGRPKGVAVSYESLSMHCHAAAALYDLDGSDAALSLAAPGFDASLEQVFVPLLSGARLVLRDSGRVSVEELCRSVQSERVTLLYPPTSRIVALASYVRESGESVPIRRCCVGGEAVGRDALTLIAQAFGAQVTNGYGPTETVITPLLWRTDDAREFRGGYAPIGRPVGERSIYVLDAHLEVVPPGVVGELYIGGLGLARGYFGQAAQTADRFVPDPFQEDGARLYRTGDLVRDWGDGVIEFVGRGDGQLKLRGFRIEPGEIEAQLTAHALVEEAVVAVQEHHGRRRLVGYVGAPSATPALAEVLRMQLAERLPDYMIPAQILVLDVLPRTAHGKVDRRALPAPVESDAPPKRLPNTATERAIAEIFAEVLRTPQVGVDQNFFELGGDSIVSLQVVSRARARGIELTPRDLFTHQTVSALARAARQVQVRAIEQAPLIGDVPLTPIQARFLAQPGARPEHYNQALLLASRERLEPELLCRALAGLIHHHDALRLRFRRETSGAWRQAYAAPDAFDVAEPGEHLWLQSLATHEGMEELCARAQRSLDLSEGPLMRAVLMTLPNGSQRLLLVIHHLVVDGVSWRVLLEDLQTAYRQLEAGRAVALPAKTSSLRTWSERLQASVRAGQLLSDLDYWRQMAQDGAELVCDPQGELLVRQRETLTFSLTGQRTEQLLRTAPEAYRTQVNDLLLTALSRALCRTAGGDAVLIELEGHGRQLPAYLARGGAHEASEVADEELDLTRTVAWFTSLFPVRLSPVLHGERQLEASIKAVKEQLHQLPNGGLAYAAAQLWGDGELRAELSRLPRPRVTFNYLGQFDPSFGPNALFELAGDAVGPTQDDETPLGNGLTFNAQVAAGRLQVGLSYSRAMYRLETVQRLVAAYERELEDVIAHCVEEGRRGVTPADFPLLRVSQAQLDGLPVAVADIEDIYPPSPLQHGLLFHSLYSAEEEQSSTASLSPLQDRTRPERDGAFAPGLYVNQLCADVEGLDVSKFERAWQSAIDRHEVLRTAFMDLGAETGLVQLVLRRAVAHVREIDGLMWGADEIERLALDERRRGFALHEPSLQRLLLIRRGARRHRLIWTHHHVLMDGWSSARLIEEILQTYASEPLAPKAGRYRDYIAWLGDRDRKADERFWRGRLSELAEPTLLSGALPNVHIVREGEAQPFALQASLDASQTKLVAEFAHRERITLSTLVQAAWALLLQRYTGQRTVAFGITVAGRPPELPDAETTLGLFINTVPMIVGASARQSVRSFLHELQASLLALGPHEHAALADIQRWAGSAARPLFDTLMVFENYPIDHALRARSGERLQISAVETTERTNYALTLEVHAGAQLSFHYKSSSAHFTAVQLEEIASHLSFILLELTREATSAVGALSLVACTELAAIEAWNPVRTPISNERCVHAWIEAQAARSPEAVAVVQGASALTYAELNARANQVARRLRDFGVGPDVLVALCMERSLELVVGLLGILKAGGAYVPLDPGYPAERLRSMIEDSGSSLLMTQARLLSLVGQTTAQIWCIDRDWSELAGASELDLPNLNGGHHLAYCIYTSGSTGRPKGVQIAHWGLSNYLAWAHEAYGLEVLSGSVLHSSIAFDLTVTSLWLPLCAGKQVELTLEGGDALEALADTVARSGGPALLKITPAHAQALVEALSARSSASNEVRALSAGCVWVVGGEALRWECVEALRRLAPGSRVINEYGPTEAVVGCCIHDAKATDVHAGSVPIGLPIANTHLYVLDRCLQPVPRGVAGELYIGGDALARGYLGRPGLTAERFVPNPLRMAESGQRLYRTGDLARLRGDGVLEYLGRNDHQVKIRGYRIELGEIEARLREHASVRDAVVIARETAGGKQIVAYVAVAREGAEVAAAPTVNPRLDKRVPTPPQGDSKGSAIPWSLDIKTRLRAVLPEYMVPAWIVCLEALPLTANGKLDRQALPAPERQDGEDAYTPPRGVHEERMAAVWASVLGVERVGRDDNFFDLGGDSILSLQIASRARSAGFALTPKDVFRHQTIEALTRATQRDFGARADEAGAADFAARAEASESTPTETTAKGAAYAATALEPKGEARVRVALVELSQDELARLPVPAQEIEQLYPLSPVQQGMLFHALYAEGAGVYISQLRVGVEGLDVARFRAAWQAVIAARDLLRTGIVSECGTHGALHLVLKHAEVPLEELDWRDRVISALQLDELAKKEHARGFDLAMPPLQRVLLVRLAEARHHLIWTHHHVLVDGWSNARLIEDVFGYYHTNTLPAREHTYRDYISWLREQDAGASERFWSEQLSLLSEPTLLARVLPPPSAGAGHGQLSVQFSSEQTAELQGFAQRERVTLNTLVQGAWLILLQRYTGQGTVAFGTTVSGRPATLEGAEEILGLFINTLPVVETQAPSAPVGSWLRSLQEHNLALREHEHCPLYDVQRWAGRKGQTLFDTIVVFENYPLERVLQEAGGSGLKFDLGESQNASHYALNLVVHPGAQWTINYAFRREDFDEAQIGAIAKHFEQIVFAMARSAREPLGSLALPTQAELHELARWSTAARVEEPRLHVQQRLALHAAEHPERIAVQSESESLSYAELNARANQLARWLRGRGVGPEVRVGVCMERSLEMVIAVLGVLKAGGAYVPLAPEYPRERLAYMIEDAALALLLTAEGLLARMPECDTELFCIDAQQAELSVYAREALAGEVVTEQLAYCIYTSGSTGLPKAVENTQRGLSNRLQWMQREYGLGSADRVLSKTPFGFDVAVAELLWPLWAGARLVLAPPGAQRDPAELAEAIRRHQVTALDFVGSMLRAFVDADELASCSSLRLITTGAEEVPAELTRAFVARHPARLVNEYGPTEAAIATTYWDCKGSEEAAVAAIGVPIANTALYVLDAHLHAAPPTVPGELCIAGVGLARGYRGRPSLTAERFVPDPFAAEPGQRMYRSGDLARFRRDGVLEFLGRLDQQVKIRGNRVELGEVEARLRELEGVRDAAVVARQVGAGKQLAAYVVGDRERSLDPLTLRARMAELLPDYMVPAQLVLLDALPRTLHGKLDRNALAAPEPPPPSRDDEPSTEVERTLAALWSEILGVEQIARSDNFFDLGGDSISSMQLVNQAKRRGLRISPKDVFQNQTIEALARAAKVEVPSHELAARTSGEGVVALAPLQCALLTRASSLASGGVPAAYALAVLRPNRPIDLDKLERALRALVEHHDSLRLRFRRDDRGSIRQEPAPSGPLRTSAQNSLLSIRRASDARALGELVAEAQGSIELAEAPLMRALWVELADGSHRLVVVLHRLVCDARSLTILLDDLRTAYGELAAGRSPRLPASSCSFERWSAELATRAGSAERELDYWTSQLGHNNAERTGGGPYDLLTNTRLDVSRTEQLLTRASYAYRTEVEDLLLTALARAWCGPNQASPPGGAVLVELEHTTQHAGDLDLTRTVGACASVFTVRLTPELGATDAALEASIKHVKEQLRSVPRGGSGLGLVRYLAAHEARAGARSLNDAQVALRYRASAVLPERDALFEVTPEEHTLPGRAPTTDADPPLVLEVEVHGGELTLFASCRRAEWRGPPIEELIRAWRVQLELLIEHCLGSDSAGLTPSDVVGGGLEQADIDALLSDLTPT